MKERNQKTHQKLIKKIEQVILDYQVDFDIERGKDAKVISNLHEEISRLNLKAEKLEEINETYKAEISFLWQRMQMLNSKPQTRITSRAENSVSALKQESQTITEIIANGIFKFIKQKFYQNKDESDKENLSSYANLNRSAKQNASLEMSNLVSLKNILSLRMLIGESCQDEMVSSEAIKYVLSFQDSGRVLEASLLDRVLILINPLQTHEFTEGLPFLLHLCRKQSAFFYKLYTKLIASSTSVQKKLELLDVQDVKTKNTALHYAVECSFIQLIVFLMEQGVNPYARNLANETPMEQVKVQSSLGCSESAQCLALLKNEADMFCCLGVRGNKLFQSKRYEASLNTFDEALNLCKNVQAVGLTNILTVYSNSARAAVKIELFQEAICRFSKAIQYCSLQEENYMDMKDIYLQRGNCYLNLKLFAEARKDFLKINYSCIHVDEAEFCFNDLYQILDIRYDARNQEIKRAFHKKCLIFHPDKSRNLSRIKYQDAKFETAKNIELEDLSRRIFAKISSAKEILLSNDKRYLYDIQRQKEYEELKRKREVDKIQFKQQTILRPTEDESELHIFQNNKMNMFQKPEFHTFNEETLVSSGNFGNSFNFDLEVDNDDEIMSFKDTLSDVSPY
eukprot:snap_masked-scaffold_8-processed-gene-11.19-mRNA-1 protein AED:1.00 eAED:1.00 QI:0/0/0/0/1/1/3/0/624